MQNKKRLLLILPSNVNIIPPFSSAKKRHASLLFGFPIGLGYIAAYLLKEGHYEVRILDANKDELTIPDIISEIKSFDPDYIGLTIYTVNSKVAVRLAREVKDNFKDKVVIAGGPHASDSYFDLFKKYPYFDFVVVGEGEITMSELLNTLDSKDYSRLKEVKGIVYNDPLTKEMFFTGERPLVKDIDQFLSPAREIVDFNAYIKKDNLLPYAIEIMGSRGCTHRCVFCSFQKVWRARKSLEIIKEMKELIKRYPRTRSFLFFDDNFSADKNRVIELCRALVNEGLSGYIWSCLCRADQVDEEMLKWMKKAGCTKIMFGLESADPQILRNLDKKITPQNVKQVVELVTKLGMDAMVFFIIGNPGETVKTIKTSYDFAKKLKCQSTVWSIMQVYPGTALAKLQPCDDFVSYLYEPEVDKPVDTISANIPAFDNSGLDREKMKLIHKKIFRDIVIYKAFHHPFFILKKVSRSPLSAFKFLVGILK